MSLSQLERSTKRIVRGLERKAEMATKDAEAVAMAAAQTPIRCREDLMVRAILDLGSLGLARDASEFASRALQVSGKRSVVRESGPVRDCLPDTRTEG